MSFLIQQEFGGVAPRVDERKLAPNLAQVADSCLFERSNLRPLRTPADIGVVLTSGVETVFPYNGAWLQYTNHSYIARSPIANDVQDRLYITGAVAYPQVRSGGATWRLGVPRPDSFPTGVAGQIPEENADNLLEIEDVYYVVTIVDAFGAEGPPSLPSAAVTRVRNDPVTVSLPSVPSGNYNLGAGARWRVYRSNTGTGSTNFQFVADVALSSTEFTDTVLNDELQEVLPSATWTGPPDDDTSTWPDGPLRGITLGPNGMMAGFAKRTVYFSEPYLPHAWPTDYTITVRHEIVGIVWISSGLLVVTEGDAVIIAGSYPGSMTVFTPEESWACTSEKSLVDMGGWAMYMSADGIVAVRDQRFEVVTAALVTNNQWSQTVPLDGVAGNAEGRYVYFWSQSPSQQGAWIFDPSEGVNALTTAAIYSDLAYHNPADNVLYINSGGRLAKFDFGTTNMTYNWKSRVYISPHPVNYAYLEVVADDYPINVTLSAGDNNRQGNPVRFDGAVTERITCLPGGFDATQWEIEVSGDEELVFIGLYEDLSEVG